MKSLKTKTVMAILAASIMIFGGTLTVMAATSLGTQLNYSVNSSNKTYDNKNDNDKWDLTSQKKYKFECKVTL